MMTRNPSRDFKVAAPVNLIVKDLGIIHDETPRCGVPILFGALAEQRFLEAKPEARARTTWRGW